MKTRSHRSTETTIETHEVWVIRRPSSPTTVWCRQCAQDVVMLSPEEAARRLRVNPRTVYRWVEVGQAHYREIENGWLLVCLLSLPRQEHAGAAFLLPSSRASD